MEKIMSLLEKFVLPLSQKLSTNKILQAISKGLMGTMPVLILGSVASIFLNIPIDAYQSIIADAGIHAILNTIVNITTNMLAVYASFMIAYTYVKNNGYNGIPAGLIALVCFFLITPMTVSGEGIAAVTNLPLSWLGPKGLFSGMILANFTGIMYSLFMKKKLVIKMPEGVPEFVSNSFVGIIPGVVIVMAVGAVSILFSFSEYGTMHQFVYSLIQTPLQGFGATLGAAIIIYILEGIVWFFGIHAIAVAAVVIPVWMAADAENLAAVANGVANADLPNIVSWAWVNSMAGVGGAGATFGLVIWLAWKSKSAKNKAVGRLALPASCFNINEPVVFGVPCVLNPTLLIPFVFTPVICIIFGYMLTTVGILPKPNGISAPAGVPIILSGFLIGGWKMALWQFCMIFVSMGIYFPFFRMLDKQAIAEEAEFEKVNAVSEA